MIETTVAELAERIGGRVEGDGTVALRGISDLRNAEADQVGFVRDLKYAEFVKQSAAGAVLVSAVLPLDRPQIVVEDVASAFAAVAQFFHPLPQATEPFLHPTAVVDPLADLEQPVRIEAHAVVSAGARIGAGSVIGPGSSVGENVSIGRDCVLFPRVVLYEHVKLGDRVVVHAGTVIGSDGFGYANEGGKWHKIPQVGIVRVEDDVEIGANSTIDRGAMGDTRIGAGTKIDNLVHVGHNCQFGLNCAVAAFSGFAGSTVFGDNCVVAGHVVTAGHQKIGDGVRIGGNSGVIGNVDKPGDYIGYPLQERGRWLRTMAVINRLADVGGALRKLARKD